MKGQYGFGAEEEGKRWKRGSYGRGELGMRERFGSRKQTRSREGGGQGQGSVFSLMLKLLMGDKLLS